MASMDSWLNNIYENATNERKFGSVNYQRPSGSFGETGFKQGVPQGGNSPFRAPNAGVRQSWDGAEIRETRTRPVDYKGAIDKYEETLQKQNEEDDDGSSSTPSTPATSPTRTARPTPSGTTASPTTGTPATTGTPTTTGTTATAGATPRRRGWLPRLNLPPTPPPPPAPLVPSTFEDLNPNQQRVVTAMEQQRAQRTAPATGPQTTTGSQPAQTPAFSPMQRTPSVMATNRPARTPASPPAPTPLTSQQQQAVTGMAEMRARRQNPSAPAPTSSTTDFDTLRNTWNPTFTSGSGDLPSTSALRNKSRAQNRSMPTSRIGKFGQERIDTNLSPFT